MRFDFIHRDFIEKEQHTDKLAVIGSDYELTWQEFAAAVDETCRYLQKNEVPPGEALLLYGHKSAYMPVVMYACMKLQIPYIPIDEIYPEERIQKVVEIAQVKWIVNTSEKALNYKNTGEIWIHQKKYDTVQTHQPDASEEKLPNDPLVYIIFTSGSTGEPKGVQISTEAVQSFTRWMTSDFGFAPSDVFINTAVLSFDLSVFEVMTFGALGATLLLNDKSSTTNPQLLMDRIDHYQGTVWVSTPSFALLFARMEPDTIMPSLRHFLFCGEVLPNTLATSLLRNFTRAKVWNTYGPTEATVATTLVEITPEIVAKYNPLPVGVSKRESELIFEGQEIIIKGSNVSRGYLNRPELNAEKFMEIDGIRAFKTGDQGYLEEDMLFFSGRNDDLVKLHGYRIELNEINANILQMPRVQNSATIPLKRNGEVKKIVALVQFKTEEKPNDKEMLIEFLASRLPGYMLPSDFKTVEDIPLNQNGKADKNLLTEIYLKK